MAEALGSTLWVVPTAVLLVRQLTRKRAFRKFIVEPRGLVELQEYD
jgi:hypothetical protein